MGGGARMCVRLLADSYPRHVLRVFFAAPGVSAIAKLGNAASTSLVDKVNYMPMQFLVARTIISHCEKPEQNIGPKEH